MTLARRVVRRAKHEFARRRSPRVPQFGQVVFSSWGEDLVIGHLLRKVEQGRYLDIGCYHPTMHSVTRRLTDQGWTGVNVDPNAAMIERFRAERPNDVSLNVAVGGVPGRTTFFMIDEWDSSNTTSADFAARIESHRPERFDTRVDVEVMTVTALMEKYFADEAPDFMNVDVEGSDHEVVASNDWDRFRPKLVAIEEIDFTMHDPGSSPTFRFMCDQDYHLVSRSIFTNFYVDQRYNRAELGIP